MRTRSKLSIAMLITAIGLAAGALTAGAGTSDRAATDVEASFKKGTADNPYVPERPPAFKGSVDSKDGDCIAKRKVKVKGVGSDKTDSKGRFKVEASGVKADTYKVKVRKREARKVVCEAAKTKVRVKARDL